MNKEKLIPELRFPEFQKDGKWNIEPLGNLSNEVVEKPRGIKYKLMSITSGIGLVSQIEKFGREIAGDSYKNYYVIHKGDFAYNKSSTKLYGEGEIAMYENCEIGAVPNSVFICFRFHQTKIHTLFAKYPFVNNLHGNWLKKFIAVGARANGALQVNVKDLFSLPFSYPTLPEQQKIASCLSSLDEIIAAHHLKLELLIEHKKGLMQNLFPQTGEKVPKYRFKEFEKDVVWVENVLNDFCFNISSGKDKNSERGKFELYGSTEIIGKTEIASYSGVHILIARVGANAGLLNRAEGNFGVTDNTLVLKLKNVSMTDFIYFNLEKIGLNKLVFGSGQPLITASQLKNLLLLTPNTEKEQQTIAACLSTLDVLIKAQDEKIEQLKLHKKGLMQGLFPRIN
jgi:type I restriction enzyme S subunit